MSTTLAEGSITGLLGRDGAAKTTLLQLPAGHRWPTAGRVEVFGRPPAEDDGVLAGI